MLTHVARCGLEEKQQTNSKTLIGPPEEYVHEHTLSIMLTQIMSIIDCPDCIMHSMHLCFCAIFTIRTFLKSFRSINFATTWVSRDIQILLSWLLRDSRRFVKKVVVALATVRTASAVQDPGDFLVKPTSPDTHEIAAKAL